MAHIRKVVKNEIIEDFAIYAIISPFGDKLVYIGRTGRDRIYKAYLEHCAMRVTKTKDLFTRARAEKKPPRIFLLTELQTTKEDSFRHCIAWTRYFCDHGYGLVSEDALKEYSEDMFFSTTKYYEAIKDLPLSDVLPNEGGLFPHYAFKEKKKKNQSRDVHFKLTAKEFEKVKAAADKNHLSVSAYSKLMAKNERVLRLDFKSIDKYLDDLADKKDLLRKILYTMYTRCAYYPADLENVQRIIDHLVEHEERIHKKISEQIDRIHE